jgi:SnoaL-like domain
MNDPDLQRLLDERAVERLMVLYCRACDRVDAELLHSLWWPDAVVEHPPYHGSAKGFCDAAIAFLATNKSALHQLGNVIVEVDGDRAHLEAYFTGWHRIPKGDLGGDLLAREAFAGLDPSVEWDVFMGGRYIKWAERRGGEWKFTRQIGFVEWERRARAEEGGVAALSLARPGKADPVYRPMEFTR